jgi:hypothetical protein
LARSARRHFLNPYEEGFTRRRHGIWGGDKNSAASPGLASFTAEIAAAIKAFRRAMAATGALVRSEASETRNLRCHAATGSNAELVFLGT